MISKKRRAEAINALKAVEFFQQARALYERMHPEEPAPDGAKAIPVPYVDDRSLQERATAILAATAPTGQIHISDDYRSKIHLLAPHFRDQVNCA